MLIVDQREPSTTELILGNGGPTLDNSAPMLDGVALPAFLADLSPAELLDVLDDAAEADVREARPKNTRDAYQQDWAAWTSFCEQLRVDPVTVRAGLFYAFVKYLEDCEYAPATVGRRLAGVIVGLRDRGEIIPEKGGPAGKAWTEIAAYQVRLVAANIERGRGQAPPLLPEQVARICEHIQPTLPGMRDRALLLIAIHIAARRSEIAKLLVSDIVDDQQGRGIEVTVRASKGGKTRTVAIRHGRHPRTCPVRAWRTWRDAASLLPSGPAFCQIRGRRQFSAAPAERISNQLAGQTITRLGRLVGLDLIYTGHSARRGMITASLASGADVKDVADISGHSLKSGTVYDYRADADRWANAANDLGF